MHAGQRRANFDAFRRGDAAVLCCTDLASRGLDTCNAHHVVNYEFPFNMADYIHRVGRVGRVASVQGSRVTSFVAGKISIRYVKEKTKSTCHQLSQILYIWQKGNLMPT